MTNKIIALLQNGNSKNVELAIQLSKALPDIDKKVILDMCLDIVLSNSNTKFDNILLYWIDSVIDKKGKYNINARKVCLKFTLCDFNYSITVWECVKPISGFILNARITENFLI